MGYSLGARDKNEAFLRAVLAAIGGDSIQHPPGTGWDMTALYRGAYLIEVKRSAAARRKEVTPLERKTAARAAATGTTIHFIGTPLELLQVVGFEWAAVTLNEALQLQAAVDEFAAETPAGWRGLARRVGRVLAAAAV